MAHQEQLERLRQGVEGWNEWRLRHWLDASVDVDLSGADLSDAVLGGADLRRASLVGADLSRAELIKADIAWSDLSHATLSGAQMNLANLHNTLLRGAILRGSSLWKATLVDADLSGADLREATLGGADLTRTNLRGANLLGANLELAVLVETRLEGADFSNSRVYGASAWNLRTDRDTRQLNLRISHRNEAPITVDDLEVAQFIYVLLTNRKIRSVIDSITTRAVLILGRFTDERKPVLAALHTALREDHGLVPILFDWEPSENRDLTETVQLLANMCRFVIADVTDAKSIPQELSAIVPHFPSVPVQPIILASQHAYAMFEHWRKFNSVLPEYRYESQEQLLDTLETGVLAPIEQWEGATDKAAAKERHMREENEAQRAEIAKLKQQLAEAQEAS